MTQNFLATLLFPWTMAAAGGFSPSVPPDYPDHEHLLVYRDSQHAMRPVQNVEDWKVRRRHILQGMQQAMGPLPEKSNLPLDPRFGPTIIEEGYTRTHVTLAAEALDRVPAWLLVPTRSSSTEFPDPAEASARLPAIVALHQTTDIGKDEPAGLGGKPNLHYGRELAQRGYVVLAPDYPSFGEYRYDFDADTHASGSIKGVLNHIRCVDFLSADPRVDPGRIGAIGHSLGGHNALFVGAFDERVRVVVSSCGWTPFIDYYAGNLRGWTSPRYMPRIADVYQLNPKQVPFDFHEVVAALAPRAVFTNAPVGDDNFAVEGVRRAVKAAREVYALFAEEALDDAGKFPVAERVTAVHPDCGHDFPPEVRRAAYQFIDRAMGQRPPASAPP